MSSSPNTVGDSSRRPHASGKNYKKNYKSDVHPDVKPKWRREDAVATAAESFSRHQSAVQIMEAAQPEPDPISSRPKGRGKASDSSKFAEEVSPKTHRDKIIEQENQKFAHSSGIAQLIGEKDRASPARPEGKTKIIRRDVHPSVPPTIGTDQAKSTECDKFTRDKEHSPLKRIGEDDHPNTIRKRVVPGRKNHPNLITPEPAPYVIKRRTIHPDKVMSTYETAIAERETRRQSAVDAQSKDGVTLLSKFSPSEDIPYRPGVKHIESASAPRGTLPRDSAIPGFPGLGSKSGVSPSGRHHYSDPNNNNNVNNNSTLRSANTTSRGASHIIGSDGIDDLSASRQHHKQKYEKTMDSHRLTESLSHPDHRPFDQKSKDSKSKKLENYPNEAPVWWPKNSRAVAGNESNYSSIGRGNNTRLNLPSNKDSCYDRPGRRVVPITGSTTPSWWPGQ